MTYKAKPSFQTIGHIRITYEIGKSRKSLDSPWGGSDPVRRPWGLQFNKRPGDSDESGPGPYF